jgi:putative ABC transport system permease protein
VNDLHLRSGRWPAAGRDEILVSEGFATGHGLGGGEQVDAVLHGRWRRFTVVGVAISPEYIYEMPPSGIFPDPLRFGVAWMDDRILRSAWGLGEGWNDASLRLAAGADTAAVIERVDALLASAGGLGTLTRDDQPSHRFVSDEIEQNRVGSTIVPAVFLGIAAFLTHIVLSRMVAAQRDQVAVLKAFGYSDPRLGAHYLTFAAVPILLGWLAGVVLGYRLAILFARIYADFYRFPVVTYAVRPGPALAGLAVTLGAGLLGALGAVRRAVRLPPAEAMRPEAPSDFRAGPVERALLGRLPLRWRIPLRQLERRPVRTLAAVLGLALAVGAVVVGRYATDALRVMEHLAFERAQRQEVTVTFTDPEGPRTLLALRSVAGVTEVEPWRAVAVRLRAGPREKKVSLLGFGPDATLHQLVDLKGRAHPLPVTGLLLSTALAERLGVRPGDSVRVELLEGDRRARTLSVAGTIDDILGLSAYLSRPELDRFLGERARASGAWLGVAHGRGPEVVRSLARLPAVAGVEERAAVRLSFTRTIAASMGITTKVLAGFAVIIAFGLVYNSARVALSERARELASLRVLGFGRGAVAALLLGEQAALLVAAYPFGMLAGWALVAIVVGAGQTELFRFPFVLRSASLAVAVIVVTIAALVSGALVWRRLDRMDLVDVLKARE